MIILRHLFRKSEYLSIKILLSEINLSINIIKKGYSSGQNKVFLKYIVLLFVELTKYLGLPIVCDIISLSEFL